MEIGNFSNTVIVLSQGFLLCASLIVAVGPQNLFILRQGLRGQHLFTIALICILGDLFLIGIGIGGLGSVIATNQLLLSASTVGGAAFLIGYGICSLRTALGSKSLEEAQPLHSMPMNLASVVLATLSFSLLNPSAYIDTVLMIGTTSIQYPADERFVFGVGAILASAVWFFTLTYGSGRLAPLFRNPVAFRALDLASGCIMVGVAMSMSIPMHVDNVVAMVW